ncbi:MAG: CPBP family intramembrane metalloprotease [Anaerolineales bacterium]|nr:CPBP family intramembrane metalloprotease [Anaerolineales bacterium]
MLKRYLSTSSPWTYFLLTFAFSWLFWLPAAFIPTEIPTSPWVVLLYAGGLGPAVAGLSLIYLTKDKAYQREYWQRILDPRRIRWYWYLVILGAYPLLVALSALAVQGQVPASSELNNLLAQPGRLLPFVFFIFIFGPLPEELGWRGYALDELQAHLSPLAASLVLGGFWALWHVPLFFMNGTFQNELGFGTLAFWEFCLSAVLFSLFVTWAYNHNRRSTLSAVIFHFSVNLTGNLMVVSPTAELARIAAMLTLAVLLVLAGGLDV